MGSPTVRRLWPLPLACLGFAGMAVLGAPSSGATGAAVLPPDATVVPDHPERGGEAFVTDKSKKARGAGVSKESSGHADKLAKADPFLSLVLANPHTVEREGPWTAYNGTVLGVLREYAFTTPVDLSMRKWPSFEYKKQEDKYYRSAVGLSVQEMSSITIFFDNKAGVVGAHPDYQAVVQSDPANGPATEQEEH